MKRKSALVLAERGLFAFGAALVAFWLWSIWAAARFQAAAGRQLEAAMSVHGAGGPDAGSEPRDAKTGALLARREAESSGLVGQLAIPRLGISSVIARGVDAKTLKQSVGHVPGTAYPGEVGSVGLAAHRDGIFRNLREIRSRDLILVTTPDGEFAFEVDSTAVVSPRRTDVLRARRDPSLILVTCYPFRWIGPAPDRFVVWAGEAPRHRNAPAEDRGEVKRRPD